MKDRNTICVYIFVNINGKRIYLSIYVDDIFIAADEAVINLENFKREISDRFKMTDLSDSNRFLGIDIERRGDNTYILIAI